MMSIARHQEFDCAHSEDVLVLRAVYKLLGSVPPTLRAVSVELKQFEIGFRCYFDIEAKDSDIELLSMAAAELISDYPKPLIMNDIYIKLPEEQNMRHLKRLVFLRHENVA